MKVGRHFRLTPEAKLIVGRNKDENEVIKSLVIDEDIVFEAKDHVGPTCILRGIHSSELLARCVSIALRYSDAPKHVESKVIITIKGKQSETAAIPVKSSDADALRI